MYKIMFLNNLSFLYEGAYWATDLSALQGWSNDKAAMPQLW
jgi:hypothetical protein